MEQVSEERIDELLELIWIMREEGRDSAEEARSAYPDGDDISELLDAASAQGLISHHDGHVSLKHAGSTRASGIIRRHRLAETLLTEILEMDESQAESEACRFEHILSQAATESVCTLLGHPPACPHGKAIPRGSCCAKFKKHMTPLVVPLSELNPGEESRIVFIAPKSHARLDRLGALGIVAGSIVNLHQKRPAYILQIGETNVALDPDIGGEIFVKRI
ncbi:MAG: metal-dependent transcriptional regulator [Armatimonadota bacterium]|nr:metal-dependent transcriptional regulator [Armatimonadota bacterium]